MRGREVLLALLAAALLAVAFMQGATMSKRQVGDSPSNPFLPSPLDTQVFGQNRWLARSPVALKVATFDRQRQRPVRSQVEVRYRSEEGERRLFAGSTQGNGVADIQFQAPEKPGSYTLLIQVRSPIGQDEVEQTIQVEEAAQVLLTTDKPLYQPGQTMHLRALALRKPDLQPAADLPLAFEVQDPKGNRVFRTVVPTSRFGIAAAEFPLAEEVNLGEYRIRALLGTGEEVPEEPEGALARTMAVAERTVRVERYVLPKFKVTVETEKRFYLPAEMLRGTVSAAYFFGKPVQGQVEVRLSTFAAGWQELAELKGSLDGEGSWRFEARLPERFVGLPLEGGKALLRVEATVTDQAEHSERSSLLLPVSSEPIQIAVVPESPRLGPNLPMRLFVVTSYPDGTPARCRFTVRGKGPEQEFEAQGETDALGLGEATVKLAAVKAKPWPALGGPRRRPAPFVQMALPPEGSEGAPITVTVKATDERGQEGQVERHLSMSLGEEAVLLRVDKAVARVGDVLHLDILASSASSAPVFVDAILHRQTVLTKTVEMQEGRGSLRLPLTADLAGSLILHAYRITPGGDIVRDTKAVFVEPANELRLHMRVDKGTYRPGEKAQLEFAVTDDRGKPTVAALGLTIVDESVFALAEMQPGLERLYFALEEELLRPRYEVHGWELRPILLQPPEKGPIPLPLPARSEAERNRIAQVLLAAAAPLPTHSLRVSTYQRKAEEVKERWLKFVGEAAERIRKALEAYQRAKGRYPEPNEALQALVDARLLTEKDVRDPLGRRYRLEPLGTNLRWGFQLVSAGLDGRFDTEDDVIAPSLFGRAGPLVPRLRREMAEMAEGPFFGAPALLMRAEGLPAALPGAEPEAAKSKILPSPPSASGEEVRVRQFFPETLFVEPQLITDEQGRASVEVPLADSITTWRLTAMANSLQGRLGSTTFPLRVFQDFFVDLDLPLAFTQGDEVAVPVALYNYLAKPQKVRLRLEAGQGFQVLDSPEQEVTLKPNEVAAARFRLRAERFGSHTITVRAFGEAMSDAIQRKVEILPDGKETWSTFSDQLSGKGFGSGPVVRTTALLIPQEAVDGARTLWVKLHPGAFTQVLEGLENLLRMPFGCFEQTSSVTYPNVLVLAYLKRTGQAQPETEMKARHFITIGYQRLLTFEVQGGGFSWFGEAPAHKVLTAYGLLEFSDMSRVHDVDPNLLLRTAQWLAGQQRPDGSWEPDRGGIHEGATTRQRDVLRTTAYIAWALTEAASTPRLQEALLPSLRKAVGYLSETAGEADDPYALAVLLNALLGAQRMKVGVEANVIERTARRLAGMAREETEVAYWESREPTPFFGRAESGDLETTALAAYGLLRHGGYGPLVSKALTYLVRKKDAFGTWQTTQATIWALKAFLMAAEGGVGVAEGKVRVRVNGQVAAEWELTRATSDLMRQVEASNLSREGRNEVEVEFEGQGSLLYQVAARYYLPWEKVPPPPEEPLRVQVDYDRTELQTRETVTCRVRVTNRRPEAAQMVIVDIGIPPGFEVLTDDLTAWVEKKRLQKFELTPRQVICYLERIEGNSTVEWSFHLRAKMPVRAKTGRTIAYEYYAPQTPGVAAPRLLTAR